MSGANAQDRSARPSVAGGYWGKMLTVDLSARKLECETIDAHLLRDFVGGYGLGAHMLLTRMPAGTPPLAENSLLGFFPGPLTGTPTPSASRFMVVGRSPLTGTWGDANCGGYFGPALKAAGYDAILITGQADKPVYLLVSDEETRIVDAPELWGLDTYATEDQLRAKHGAEYRVACIGPSGEACSLTAAIISEKARAAARSGLGAIMGAKRLKAIVAGGHKSVPLADPQRVEMLRRTTLEGIKKGFGASDFLRTTGTPGYTLVSVRSGDAPIKNWAGTLEDFSDLKAIEPAALEARRKRRYACYKCPIGCGGWWEGGEPGARYYYHFPEYETIGAFGPLCLVSDMDAVGRANDLCNRYGVDTISTGGAVAFAIECFEKGLLHESDLGGLRPAWGDAAAVVRLTEMIVRREGFGAILADGLEVAERHLGPASHDMAIHIRGEALPMHDPRFEPGLAVIYALDPTPARHAQANQMEIPPGFDIKLPPREVHAGRGLIAKRLSHLIHVVNSSGFCLFGIECLPTQDWAAFLAAVTGWERELPELEALGKGIADARQQFNLREGINLVAERFPARALGQPPATTGPWQGVTIDPRPMAEEFLGAMGWAE